MLTTKPNAKLMSKFLKPTIIKSIVSKNFSGAKINYLNIKRIFLLSQESFLVTYDLDIIYKNNLEFPLFLRGNRIHPQSALMWQYIYKLSQKDKLKLVPKPLHYFEREMFMIYEEFKGHTLRDYDSDYLILKAINPAIARKLAWWHNTKTIEKIPHRAEETDEQYLKSVEQKINTYLPNPPKWLSSALADINKFSKEINLTQPTTLCHNDFQASNIIYNPRTKDVGIIDFGASTIFTPATDIATYLVHLAVMTNKCLPSVQITNLQKIFIKEYFKKIKPQFKKSIARALPLYQARVAADIIATTAVALSHTKNPYRRIIPEILLPVIKNSLRIFRAQKNNFDDFIIHLKKHNVKIH